MSTHGCALAIALNGPDQPPAWLVCITCTSWQHNHAWCSFSFYSASFGVERSQKEAMPQRQLQKLMTGLAFGEAQRWHAGRLWVSDWGTREIITVGLDGKTEVMVRLDFPSFQAICMDWLPDGRLLIVSSLAGRLLCRQPNGSLLTYADLNRLSDKGWNGIVVDGRGNAYVNGGGFNLAAGEPFAPGIIALVTPDGSARQVADGIAFPNGMAVTADNATLIVAESYAQKLTAFDIAADGSLLNRRVWAELGDGAPGGVCIESGWAGWYADGPNRW